MTKSTLARPTIAMKPVPTMVTVAKTEVKPITPTNRGLKRAAYFRRYPHLFNIYLRVFTPSPPIEQRR
ncbi:MAG: hypothetical protein DDT40_01698 [candidate division WS2 bacterium]|nr:hypothetical protein [Candidatus Psychracetigena formicireducens]